MTLATLQLVLLALAGVIDFFWIVYALTGPRKIQQPDVLHVLRYGSILRTSALILALAPPTLMGCAAWLLLWRDVATLAIAGGCFLVTSVIGALLLLEVESVQIAVTEDGLTRYSRWKKPVTLQWVEVEHIRYSTVNRWFVVAGVGRRIHVSRHLSGIAGFVEVMRRKLATARLSAVQSVLDAILNEK